MKCTRIFLLLVASFAPLAVAETSEKESSILDDLNYGFWVDWSTRHTSKGRDYLDGRGAFSQGLYLGAHNFGIELNRSGAMDDGTKEFNFDLSYYREFDSFSLYSAYEYLDWDTNAFQVDGSNLAFGTTYFDLPAGLWVSADVEYSIDRNGFFSELSLGADIETTEWLTITPALTLGANSGYVDDGHEGLNHAVASFTADFQLTEYLQLSANASYNWAINRESDLGTYPDDAILQDFFWAGLTLIIDGDAEEPTRSRSSSKQPWRAALGTSAWATAWNGSVSIGATSPGTVEELDDSYDQLHTGVSIETGRAPWSILFDGSYTSFGAEVPPPLPVFASTPVEVRMASIQAAAGYRILDARRGSIDLLAGASYQHLEAEYLFTNPVSRELNWIDPSIGFRARLELLRNMSLSTRAEIGGFDVGSDHFLQVEIGLGYQFSDHISLELYYRHLEAEYTKDNDAVEFSSKGPRFGLNYRF